MARKEKSPARDLYQEITDRIVAALEEGTVAPWHRPWAVSPLGSLPRNAVTGRPYRGINVMLAMLAAWNRGYGLPLWLSFKQANEVAAKAARKAGYEVEKNARGTWVFASGEFKGRSVGGIRAGQNKVMGCGATEVIFWKPIRRTEVDEEGTDRRRTFMLMRTYQIFNISQCDAATRQFLAPDCEFDPETGAFLHGAGVPGFSPIEAAERICGGYACEVVHGGDRACYSIATDTIHLPPRAQFATPEHYYTTRFHEMGHSTGHPSRLDREGIAGFDFFGSHQYAEEELVAEFTACFLAGEAGIVRTVEGSSTSYLQHWAAKLKEDKKIVVNAAQRAQKAADFVLGRATTVVEAEDEAEDEEAA